MRHETESAIVEIITMVRLELYNKGEHCGAKVIREEMRELDIEPLPSVSKINRILSAECLTNGRTGYYPEDYMESHV